MSSVIPPQIPGDSSHTVVDDAFYYPRLVQEKLECAKKNLTHFLQKIDLFLPQKVLFLKLADMLNVYGACIAKIFCNMELKTI